MTPRELLSRGPEGEKNVVFREANSKDVSYRVGAMLKHVSSSMRRFVADIKKGFKPSVVREILIEDLNQWSSTQTRGHWQFFERDDAPEEFPDIPVKGKKNKKVKKEKIDITALTESEMKIIENFRKMKENK